MPAGRGEITVAYLTSTIRHRNVEVPLTPADGVPRNCVVNLDSINTIPKACPQPNLHAFRCPMAEVKTAVIEALDLK